MNEPGHVYQERQNIPEQYLWNLEDIYPNEDLWEKDLQAIAGYVDQIQPYCGHVVDTAENLYNTLELQSNIYEILERVAAYAMLHRDQNTTDQHNQGLYDRASALSVQVESKLSFIRPEILKLTPEKLAPFLVLDDRLEKYRHFLENLQRQGKHFRSPEEEEIIALTGEMAQAPTIIFSLLTNADMEFPEIDVLGEKTRLTQGNFIDFMHHPVREIRQTAYSSLYKTFAAHSNTIGAAYSSSIKADLFHARVRRYESALETALDPDNLPVSFFDKLLESVHRHLPALHRYIALKKKQLKLDELLSYDLYVPLTGKSQWKPSIEAAQQTVIKGLSALGKEYTTLLEKGFRNRWLDVFETKGKRSGAYSMGVYGIHPYVLLNYQPSLENVFTIAHEMGHALHSFYTNKTQPYIYSHYPILLAEVASTVNEALLFQYLFEQAETNEKAALLEKNLEQFRTTVFRQILFAEFEKKVHELAKAGEPLTPDKFNEVYGELLEKYYGPHLVLDDYIRNEWARIPHFYSSFYVYKYATGFSAAVAISEMVLKEGEIFVERYMEFLKSGNSDYPLETLKNAGVNLASGEPVDKALCLFEKHLEKFENILNN
ncbi:oligoendopeptidase F [Phosphitispora sp. TUW77]|uniref:oligoendopeptidase F n=1 Tax=Phosphitispora sp. TUW77 TaxID=3152361 RepID=UPI003AB3AE37